MSKLGKFLTGVSAVAVPAALENQRAKIQAMRDERLNSFQAAESEKGRTFTAGENAETRAASAKDSALNRAFQAREGVQNRMLQQEGQQIQREGQQAQLEYQGMQYMANEAERKDRLKVIEANLKTAGIEQDLKKLELDDAKQMRAAYDTIMDADLSDEERLAAIEYVNLRNPRSNNKFAATQLKDENGDPMLEVFVLNQQTGEGTRMDLMAAPSAAPSRGGAPSGGGSDAPATPKTQAEFDALPSGALFIDPDDGKTYRKP